MSTGTSTESTFIGARVDEMLLQRINEIADSQGTTRSWIIRRALRNYVMKPDMIAPQTDTETSATLVE